VFKIYLAIILLVFVGCGRKPAPPQEAYNLLPWGAVNEDTSQDSSIFDLKNSLGSSLIYKVKTDPTNKQYNILAISGGGSHGAYGAGLLDGWYQSGNMPKFDVVTGISTGSIISSFVFLGSKNIDKIAKLYTSIETSDIYYYNFFKIFGGSSISSTTPLKNMIKREITADLLEKVAQQYKKGRRLYVGTTNIDTGHLVVWDMTAIASSSNKNKLQLYRDIIYASSAMPGVFDPQYFEINYRGQKYYQLHIDGGMNSYVFMVGLFEDWNKILHLKNKLDVSIYVLANRQYRYKKPTKPLKDDSALSILIGVSENSMDLLFDRSVYRLYTACQENGYRFYYTGIDDNVTLKAMPHQFYKDEMQRLFDEGFKKGSTKIDWQRKIDFNEVNKHK